MSIRHFRYWRGYYREQLARTLGTLALTWRWMMLRLVCVGTGDRSGSHQHHPGAFPTILYSALHWVDMTVGRWFLQRLATYYSAPGGSARPSWRIYMGVVASALITELIGIHLIFGAFLLGAAMPKNAGLVRGSSENRRLCSRLCCRSFFCLQWSTDANWLA